MNAKPTAYPILEHKHSTAMSGIEPKKYIGEKTTYMSPPCEAEASKNIIKYKESSVRLPLSADNTILAD